MSHAELSGETSSIDMQFTAIRSKNLNEFHQNFCVEILKINCFRSMQLTTMLHTKDEIHCFGLGNYCLAQHAVHCNQTSFTQLCQIWLFDTVCSSLQFVLKNSQTRFHQERGLKQSFEIHMHVQLTAIGAQFMLD